jgi:glycosyltransferase involved in cell wall biosynthesis
MNVYFVYEGRLGSTRADSTYVQENAVVTKSLAKVSVINSRRKNWTLSEAVKSEFKVINLGKPFDPKNIFQSIKGQLLFGLNIRKFLNTSTELPCILIFHNWWALQALHGIRRNRKKILLVLEVHDQLPLRGLWPKAFAHVDLFIATNRYKFEELTPYFADKLLLEKNSVRLSRYESVSDTECIKASWGAKEGGFVLGYTGSFGPEKNPGFLAECARQSSDTFLIVGSLPLLLKPIYQEIGNVLILGQRSRNEIPSIQFSCDALVITLDPNSKQSSLYTSTMKLMEYVAAKRPIVAPELPAILEMLDESEFYKFKADSVQSFLDAVDLLKSDIRRGSVRMPRESRLIEYSWVERNKRILAKCEELLASSA